MTKKPWAKGRREKQCPVMISPDIHQLASKHANKKGVTLKQWISGAITVKAKIEIGLPLGVFKYNLENTTNIVI